MRFYIELVVLAAALELAVDRRPTKVEYTNPSSTLELLDLPAHWLLRSGEHIERYRDLPSDSSTPSDRGHRDARRDQG